MLPIGSVLSYSAGTAQLDPDAYRVVRAGEDRLASLARTFPELVPALSGRPLLIISCYPATLGTFANATFVDTYLKWETFARAMLLAERECATPIVLAQPLYLLHAFLRYAQRELPWPSRTLACTGGYACPWSLERTLLATAERCGALARVLHCYGAAEVDAACLGGIERTPAGEVIYKNLSAHVVPAIRDGRLFLDDFDTGDHAELTSDGAYLVRNAQSRLGGETLRDLESWSADDWQRRTGYLVRDRTQRIYQLREGLAGRGDAELDYHAFQARFRGSWLDKPDWR
jgi:hypothetical protein